MSFTHITAVKAGFTHHLIDRDLFFLPAVLSSDLWRILQANPVCPVIHPSLCRKIRTDIFQGDRIITFRFPVLTIFFPRPRVLTVWFFCLFVLTVWLLCFHTLTGWLLCLYSLTSRIFCLLLDNNTLRFRIPRIGRCVSTDNSRQHQNQCRHTQISVSFFACPAPVHPFTSRLCFPCSAVLSVQAPPCLLPATPAARTSPAAPEALRLSVQRRSGP